MTISNPNPSPIRILASVKQAIRDKYAWPGGYPLYILMHDGEALSIAAARDNFRQICQSTIGHHRDGWEAAGVDVNWEDGDLYCAHTGERIEAAYGELDA